MVLTPPTPWLTAGSLAAVADEEWSLGLQKNILNGSKQEGLNDDTVPVREAEQ